MDEKTLISEVKKKYGSHKDWEILGDIIDIINEDGPSFTQFRQLGYSLNGSFFEDELLGLYAWRICLQLASDEDEILEIADACTFRDYSDLAEQIDDNPDDAVAIIDKFIASR